MHAFADDDDQGVLEHWLCTGCGAPQSRALAICLECGGNRPAPPATGRRQRRRVAYSVVLALMLLASLLVAGGAV